MDGWVAFATALGGGGIGWVVKGVSGHFLAAKDQPFQQAMQLIAKLESRVDMVEKHHKDCMDGRSQDAALIGGLRVMVDDQAAKIKSLEQCLESIKKTAS
jgi:hypothetical protein